MKWNNWKRQSFFRFCESNQLMCLARKETESIAKHIAVFFFLLFFTWKGKTTITSLVITSLNCASSAVPQHFKCMLVLHGLTYCNSNMRARLVEYYYYFSIQTIFWQFCCKHCSPKGECTNVCALTCEGIGL